MTKELLDLNPKIQLLIMNDSCEAFSIFDDFHSLNNTLLIGSSVVDVMSVSSGFDYLL
jgi:glycosylphosphatidylinositol transamidase (GPIT) subunit GPI8